MRLVLDIDLVINYYKISGPSKRSVVDPPVFTNIVKNFSISSHGLNKPLGPRMNDYVVILRLGFPYLE